MKKLSILFSFAFLFLISISAESFATSSCTNTSSVIRSCTSYTSGLSCTGSSSTVTNSAYGCTSTFTDAVFTSCINNGATTTSCESVIDVTICSNLSGCSVTGTTDSNSLTTTICNGLKIVNGTFGKVVAAFAIISVGIGFFTGKVSWGLMIGVTAGIAAMFGAPTIVSAISGSSVASCS